MEENTLTKIEYYKFLYELEFGVKAQMKTVHPDESDTMARYLMHLAQIELELDTIPEMLNFEDWAGNKEKLIERFAALA